MSDIDVSENMRLQSEVARLKYEIKQMLTAYANTAEVMEKSFEFGLAQKVAKISELKSLVYHLACELRCYHENYNLVSKKIDDLLAEAFKASN